MGLNNQILYPFIYTFIGNTQGGKKPSFTAFSKHLFILYYVYIIHFIMFSFVHIMDKGYI